MSYSQNMAMQQVGEDLDKLTELRKMERLYITLIKNLLRNRNFNGLLQQGLSDKIFDRKVKKNFEKYGIQTKSLHDKQDLLRVIKIVKKTGGIKLWDDPSENDVAELFGINPIEAQKFYKKIMK